MYYLLILFQLNVTAYDLGKPSKSSFATIIVNIERDADQLRFLIPDQTFTIDETKGEGEVVGRADTNFPVS